eukprot:CAMPEP_0170374712 /NCGR_PEP_ID=MMETSP0117_2-20130122/10763_1 /TAXON_ID=400756 /ORGANISM="Durinskia baltica, Strain CSIRO CS-38" /LENGTH=367 /DNA_ID=CAMNT_0010629717 /DNA_START=194 /DNA_END=1300 /DNA_ORIENTATION=+
MRSPYAAPHTPIASSKRPRIAPKTKSTAIGSPKATSGQSVPRIDENVDNGRKTSVARREPAQVPPTPSKVLFSPVLRTDPATGITSTHQHHLREEDDEDEQENMVENQLTEDAGPSTPIVSASVQQQQQEEEEEEDDGDEFNPYKFIAYLPPHASVCIMDKICLPPLPSSSNKQDVITLALDLDETLVHCTVEPIPKPDLVFPVKFNNETYQIYVRKRPYLDYFLETVSKSFEVVVFTASQKVYADVLLDKLDPSRKLIKHRLFREACLLVQGNYLKDLHVLGRDLRKTLLVDNSPHAYSYHTDNGIPIESWYDDDNDTELLKLIGFLKSVQNVDDVRPTVREHFKTYNLVERARNNLSVSLSAPPF